MGETPCGFESRRPYQVDARGGDARIACLPRCRPTLLILEYPDMFSEQRQLTAARRFFEHVARVADLPFSLRLWDGTIVPLGRAAPAERYLAISGPGVLGSLMRRPSLDNLFRHYVRGQIDLHGSDLIGCFELVRRERKRKRLRLGTLRKGLPWADVLPLLLSGEDRIEIDHQVRGAEAGRRRTRRSDKDLIQFHYDVGNDFYALFLDSEMVYSCAYFADRSNPLDRAQKDKLDLICRKLRLRPGERFLDIGSGWGALICHAAQHYGVQAHGVTLSQTQHDYARDKIERLGLQDRATVALRDYTTLDGRYDKIASIGMYEHVGIANYPAYFGKIHSLLDEHGVFLNHGITRRAKKNPKNFGKISPGKQVILKYIFPGSELDHIGHTLQAMESCGFEVHDVEGLRLHYARTCRLWYEGLVARQNEAIAIVGPERYRMWLAYLGGVAGAFEDGPLHVYQTVATRQASGGFSPLPPTRADLYRERPASPATPGTGAS
jgi:cyclopropane-fatty-acyl-phospholipid synthase